MTHVQEADGLVVYGKCVGRVLVRAPILRVTTRGIEVDGWRLNWVIDNPGYREGAILMQRMATHRERAVLAPAVDAWENEGGR